MFSKIHFFSLLLNFDNFGMVLMSGGNLFQSSDTLLAPSEAIIGQTQFNLWSDVYRVRTALSCPVRETCSYFFMKVSWIPVMKDFVCEYDAVIDTQLMHAHPTTLSK